MVSGTPISIQFTYAADAYVGRENDGTGLYLYRARYYSPVIQRFISEDPISFRGGNNVYRYASDSPVALTDPFGLWTVSIGLSVNLQLGPINLQGSSGLALDSSGNFGTYALAGGGGLEWGLELQVG